VSFDGVAPWYRLLEALAFGGALQRARVAFLGEIARSRRTLIIGEGDGRFLCELLRAYPEMEVDCVDASERMLSLAQRRIAAEFRGRALNVRFLQRDITLDIAPEDQYDLIVTHFVLDCFPEAALSGIVANLARSAKPDAVWLLADFCQPMSGFAWLKARIWLAVMYQFFRHVAGIKARKLVDPSLFLRFEGFVLARENLFRHRMLKSQLWRRN